MAYCRKYSVKALNQSCQRSHNAALCAVRCMSKKASLTRAFVWALLYFGWRLEFGWHESDVPKSAEAELKEKYKALHDGRLPALVER